jgi:hypothetical protein
MQHKDFARALRRHHLARLKKARQFYWGRGLRPGMEWTPRALGMVAHTPQICSCYACGNWRRTEGRTMQEKRVYQESVWAALDAVDDGKAGDCPDDDAGKARDQG